VLAALAVAGATGAAIVWGGLFDVRASTPHSPAFAWATHRAMISFMARDAVGVAAPARFSQAQVLAGLQDYDANCAACHGGPGVGRAQWVEGMNPPPPYLLDAARQWTPSELYLIVGQGVKMTGMPAWTFRRTDAQLWDIVAFLEALPKMSPADYQRLRRSPASVPP
jgi:mono/diheme cytochrome c family protein